MQLFGRSGGVAFAAPKVLREPVDQCLDPRPGRQLRQPDSTAAYHQTVRLWVAQDVLEHQLVPRESSLQRSCCGAIPTNDKTGTRFSTSQLRPLFGLPQLVEQLPSLRRRLSPHQPNLKPRNHSRLSGGGLGFHRIVIRQGAQNICSRPSPRSLDDVVRLDGIVESVRGQSKVPGIELARHARRGGPAPLGSARSP